MKNKTQGRRFLAPIRMGITGVLALLALLFFVSGGLLLLAFDGYFSRNFGKGVSYQVVAEQGQTQDGASVQDVFCTTTNPADSQVSTQVLGYGKDGTASVLFSIEQEFQQGYGFFKEPRAQLSQEGVAVYFDGRQYEALSYHDTGQQLLRFHDAYAPALYFYSFAQGTVQEIRLPKAHMALLDVFPYQGRLYVLAEAYNTLWISGTVSSTTSLLEIQGDAAVPVAKLGQGAVGGTPLIIKGYQQDSRYYYPSAAGIMELDMESLTAQVVLPTPFTHHEEVEIAGYGTDFVVVAQQVTLGVGGAAQRPVVVSQTHTTQITQYSKDFAQENQLILDYSICDIYWGGNGVMLSLAKGDFSKLTYVPEVYVEVDFPALTAEEGLPAAGEQHWVQTDGQWMPVEEPA